VVSALPDRAVSAIVSITPKKWLEASTLAADSRTSKWRSIEQMGTEARSQARINLEDRIRRGEFPEIDVPLVSVIIPVHDDAEFIDEAIESVFNQTRSSFEIIVVNDGSTDAQSLEILDRLAWPRTTVISQPNRGLAAARNAGVRASSGAFIVPLDVDDALEPRFLEAQLEVLEANDSIAYTTTWSRLTGDVEAVWIPRPFNEYQILLSNSNVGCVVLRRSAFDSVGGYDEELRSGNEDWDLWVRLMAAGHTMVEIPEVLFRYRKHGITMSVRTEARFESARLEMVASHADLYEPSALVQRKRRAYPALSVVVPDAAGLGSLLRQSVADAEILVVGSPSDGDRKEIESRGWSLSTVDSVDGAIATSIGKYVTLWDPTSEAAPQLLHRLAITLEEAPDAGFAATATEAPVTVVRRWSLADPDAPSAAVFVESAATAAACFHPGDRPAEEWQRPTEVSGLPVHRQRPEESGFIPDWTKT